MTMAEFKAARGTITSSWPSLQPATSNAAEPKAEPKAWHLAAIALLCVGCVVAWRQGAFYSGGVDPVVALKALMQSAALAWAWVLAKKHGLARPLGIRSLNYLLMILSVSLIGAVAAGDVMASAVIAIRVIMMALTLMLVMRSYSAEPTLLALALAMAIVGVLSAGTGLALGGGARLSGGIPPLSPNEIALLAGVPALLLLHEGIRARVHWWHLALLVMLAGMLLLSESRTALIGAAAASGLMLILVRHIPLQTVIAALVAFPLLTYALLMTPILQNLMAREDSASLLTLNSRTISWSAVLNLPWDSWQRWVGTGLSTKTIPVEGQYWEEQVFDSSWISLLAQSGIIGIVIAAVWIAGVVFRAMKTAKARTLYLPLLAFILVRSFMENGLIDAGVMFLAFFAISLNLERPSAQLSIDWGNNGTLSLTGRSTQ